jgi:hypothetical protein
VAEAIGDGSEKVANQPKQHLRGSTERSNRGIISAMRDSGVVKKTRMEYAVPRTSRISSHSTWPSTPSSTTTSILIVDVFEHILYLGHPHGHQDVAAVLLHSFFHDDERVIFVNHNYLQLMILNC